MPKIRRAGFVFFAWKGDHAPRHVHVYRDGRLVLRWNLERRAVMKGRASRRLLAIIAGLVEEGVL